jgi:hypothetical protein
MKNEMNGEMADCSYISFILDGKKYTAVEDPSDGYRSCMDRLIAEEGSLKNIFPDTKVMIPCSNSDILSFYSVENGMLVMAIGTDHSDDYYPSFVGLFIPENLPVNTNKRESGLIFDAESPISPRDWFAGMALAGRVFGANFYDTDEVAAQCYKIADAMITERNVEAKAHAECGRE